MGENEYRVERIIIIIIIMIMFATSIDIIIDAIHINNTCVVIVCACGAAHVCFLLLFSQKREMQRGKGQATVSILYDRYRQTPPCLRFIATTAMSLLALAILHANLSVSVSCILILLTAAGFRGRVYTATFEPGEFLSRWGLGPYVQSLVYSKKYRENL
jgi:hypothetical protein